MHTHARARTHTHTHLCILYFFMHREPGLYKRSWIMMPVFITAEYWLLLRLQLWTAVNPVHTRACVVFLFYFNFSELFVIWFPRYFWTPRNRRARRKAYVQCSWNMSYVPFQGKSELIFLIFLTPTASFFSVLLPRSSPSSLSLSLSLSFCPSLPSLSHEIGISKSTIADRCIEIA